MCKHMSLFLESMPSDVFLLYQKLSVEQQDVYYWMWHHQIFRSGDGDFPQVLGNS
nr:MAG: hypothetical protein [Microvirus sp.]